MSAPRLGRQIRFANRLRVEQPRTERLVDRIVASFHLDRQLLGPFWLSPTCYPPTVDIERTMEFILESQAKAEVRMAKAEARMERSGARVERAEARAAKTDKRIESIAKILQQGLRMLAKAETKLAELAQAQKELAQAQKATERRLRAFLGSRRNGRNGRASGS